MAISVIFPIMSDNDFADDLPKVEDYVFLVGKTFKFEDEDTIQVTQVKRRDTGAWVTYHVQQGPGIPRKMVMQAEEFMHTYGHLFK